MLLLLLLMLPFSDTKERTIGTTAHPNQPCLNYF
jgi:hypothetical protein